jgi:hypothetical protein
MAILATGAELPAMQVGMTIGALLPNGREYLLDVTQTTSDCGVRAA